MKKVLVLSLVLIFALGVLMGCAPKTDKPSPAGPKADGENGLSHISSYSLHYALKDNPEPGEIMEMQDNKAPREAALIIFKVARNEKSPDDVETDVVLMQGEENIAERVVMSRDLKDKDVLVMLHREGESFEAGDYKIVVRPKKGKGLIEKTFTIIESQGIIIDDDEMVDQDDDIIDDDDGDDVVDEPGTGAVVDESDTEAVADSKIIDQPKDDTDDSPEVEVDVKDDSHSDHVDDDTDDINDNE